MQGLSVSKPLSEQQRRTAISSSSAAIAGAGASLQSGVLTISSFFDFEAGITTDEANADIFFGNIHPNAPQYADIVIDPRNGAGFCSIGNVPFPPISFSDLQGLTYSTSRIGLFIRGPMALAIDPLAGQGYVSAFRTKNGNFVKVRTLDFDQSNYTFHIEWQVCKPINYLDVKVTLGSAPVWLVTRYTAECTYTTSNGIQNCGRGTFGPDGGTIQGQVSDETGAFPESVVVTVTLDFQPDTNLAALVKSFTPMVTDTGVNFIFEPNQVIQNTNVFFDLRPSPKTTDYLLLRWNHHNADGSIVASGQKYLSGDELSKQPVTQYEIVFVPDPISAKDLNIQIDGRFQDTVLTLFNQTYELANKAVLIKAQTSTSGTGYMLVSV